MMESRIIEYPRPGGGLDYHSSPLIGEIPTSDYSYYRSIDQLRTTINERDVLQTIATSTPLHNSTTGGASTTDLRAIEFSHKSFMSAAAASSSEQRSNAVANNENGEMHHQLHQHNHHHHHENQSNKHQHHNNHNLMDDRANNNVHYNSTGEIIATEIKTKSYRKNRKHNRNASANNSYNNNISPSSSSSSLHQQQNNNYHQQHNHHQVQPYQQTLQHQSTNESPHPHNNDHPEDEMIAGPVTGQTKEMKVGCCCCCVEKNLSCVREPDNICKRETVSCIENIYKTQSGKNL